MLNRIISTDKKIGKCRFCSKEAAYPRIAQSIAISEDVNAFIECGKCGARGPMVYLTSKPHLPIPEKDIKSSVDKAIRLWNK